MEHKLSPRIRAATGAIQPELVLKNADYLNVFTGELLHGDIAVHDGVFVGIGDYDGIHHIDVSGKIVIPGLIDAHIHLESAMVSPAEFARAVVPHGTTTVMCDPHEITNVCAHEGIRYMLESTKDLPLDVYFLLPSCVPSMPFEESGAVMKAEDLKDYYARRRVLGLAEMMNFPGVVMLDDDVLDKLEGAASLHQCIDGHAPGMCGKDLNGYVTAGVQSDHECTDYDEALEKLRAGQMIMIREGTAAQNLEALIALLTPQTAHRVLFCTDDKHPWDLRYTGHMDAIIRKAIALGANPRLCVRAASYNAAKHFSLRHHGAIAPGYHADFAVIDDFAHFNVLMTGKNGRIVYDGTSVTNIPAAPVPASILNTMHADKMTAKQFAVGERPLMGLHAHNISTDDLGNAPGMDVNQDILKMAVVERHKNTGHMGLCYVKGYGLKEGAIATSVAHDCHNLIGVGTNDEDLACAMNAIIDMNGGIVVVKDGAVVTRLPLTIAGLMSTAPLEEVCDDLETCKKAAWEMGVSHDIDPFMTLSFMSLPAVPTIHLTTKGVFDLRDMTLK